MYNALPLHILLDRAAPTSRRNEFPDTNEQHRQVIFTNDA